MFNLRVRIEIELPPQLARALSISGAGREWSVLCNGGKQEMVAQAASLGAQVVEQRCPTLDEIFVARAAHKQTK